MEKLMPNSAITMYGKGNMKEWKDSVCLISNKSRNISNHAFCLMKLKGLKEEHYVNEIAPKDTKIRIQVLFWS